jgi:transposase
MLEDAGVVLAFLPPYSPDLNPIELSFAQLKRWIQRNRELSQRMEFDDFLRLALETLRESVKCHFWTCRIGRMGPRDQDSDMEDDLEDDYIDENG